ncbi:MAG: methyltransferase domain-containing protein [Pirellulales bacterium]
MHKLDVLSAEESPIKGRLNVESAVRERYAAAANNAEPALCCPIDYDARYLEILPAEIIERDYGCGDPSRYVREGETVLDLGSGGGKICYIAAQIVGPKGRVVGVDRNDDMLALARRYQDEVGKRIGYRNTEFRKGSIQDLALDLEAFEAYLAEHPIHAANDWLRAEAFADELRHASPMIADESIDVVISNCVLNLVREADRRQLFEEVYRVLRVGGRAAISDIVCDEPVPEHLKHDHELWSGCISGAFVESEFLSAFEAAGFHGLRIVDRQAQPWAVIEGIEFRSLTVEAFKGEQGECLDGHHAVIYRGPWKAVLDDDGQTLHRGERMAVCARSFERFSQPPYADEVFSIPPSEPVASEDMQAMDCRGEQTRDPRVTKGMQPHEDRLPGSACCDGDSCCS